MNDQRISVIGLGKLGIPFAAAAASKGMSVLGVEMDKSKVDLVNQGKAPVFEPGLQEMMSAHRSRIRATSDFREAVLGSSISFLIVPTPSDERGAFSLKFINQAAEEIGRALREKTEEHLVVVTSTVLPGSTEYSIVPTIEKASGKKCGQGFRVCYNPEFIALGSVIKDLLHPDFVLIGQSDETAGKRLEAWYASFTNNRAPIARMNLVNAELTKISINTYVTTKITFANMLATICEELPGGDIDAVTNAIGMDSRIGKRYLTGALGYGGPCFPRDNRALSFLAHAVGASAPLAESTDEANRELVRRQCERIVGALPAGSTVAVLGLAYKPDTNVIDESQSISLAKGLVENGNRVVVFDPHAMETTKAVLQNNVIYAASLAEALKNADAVVIMNACPEFKTLETKDFPRRPTPTLVVDCWRILAAKLRDCEWIRYAPLGTGTVDGQRIARLEKIWQSAATGDRKPAQPKAAPAL